MGTSKSSPGPGKGVNLVPDWLDLPPAAPPPVPPPIPPLPPGIPNAPPREPPTPPDVPNVPPGEQPPAPPAGAPTKSTPRRFTDARRAVGDFIRTGDRGRLRSGLGSYAGRGYRGGGNAASRMGQAATSAGRAYDVLTRVADATATPAELGFDLATLADAPVDDVIDALVDAICRSNTTLDDNAGRTAVNEALSEVLEAHPDLDALAMPVEQAEEVWLRTLAYHVYDDVMHDLGGRLQNAVAGDHVLFNDRCLEIRSFILESYREQSVELARLGQRPTNAAIHQMGRQLNAMVFDVYAGWLQ